MFFGHFLAFYFAPHSPAPIVFEFLFPAPFNQFLWFFFHFFSTPFIIVLNFPQSSVFSTCFCTKGDPFSNSVFLFLIPKITFSKTSSINSSHLAKSSTYFSMIPISHIGAKLSVLYGRQSGGQTSLKRGSWQPGCQAHNEFDRHNLAKCNKMI